MAYEQLTISEVRSQILAHLKDAERKHLAADVNATVNEECAKLCTEAGNERQAKEYQEAAAQQRREAEAFLRGAALLKTKYADVLGSGGTAPEPPPVRI
jgi:phosphotransacetylase